jgi:archaetidylinositol phosphate synthase
LWLSNLGLLFHWLGDSLDGTLARLRRIERPRYGFYLDQVIDTVGNLLIGLGVGFCPGMRMELILILLAVYQMLAIQVLVHAIVDGEFRVTVGHMGPTELRLGILLLNLVVLAIGTPAIPGLPVWLHWEDLVLGVAIAGLLGLFVWQMREHLAKLAKEDPGAGAAHPAPKGLP